MIRSRFVFASSFAALLALLALAASPAPQEPAPLPQEPAKKGGEEKVSDPSLADRLVQWRKDLRSDAAGVARALKSVDLTTAAETDRLTWLRLARDTAVRLGDAVWLQELKSHEDPFSEVFLYGVLLAGGYVAEGDLAAAKRELARIEDVDRVNDRDKRRYFALQARIAQLEGDATAETVALSKIVEELQYWPRKSCQGCHDDPKDRTVPPLLPVLDTWFAERLVGHLRGAEDLPQQIDELRSEVEAEPKDPGHRIELALRLLARGERAQAEAALQPIPWVLLPGREGGKPRMMTVYP